MTRAKQYPGIAPDLWPLVIPVEELTTHPRNARQGDVGAISESLRIFGQQKPVVAQKAANGEPSIVVAGNHMLMAALALGWSHVAAVRSEMDDVTALRYLVADNRTQELGTYDDEALSNVLAELAMHGHLEATGYDGDDVDAMLKRLAAPEEFADVTETETDYKCPSCGYTWSGTPK